MDDLASKLSELLESPEGLESIKSMASALLGGDKTEDSGQSAQSVSGVSTGDVQNIMKVVSAMKSQGDDDRTRLLLALRPHLSEERRPRIDRAVKLMKLAGLLPLLQETDLLKLLD